MSVAFRTPRQLLRLSNSPCPRLPFLPTAQLPEFSALFNFDGL
jgi:hypothetical protein